MPYNLLGDSILRVWEDFGALDIRCHKIFFGLRETSSCKGVPLVNNFILCKLGASGNNLKIFDEPFNGRLIEKSEK